MRLNTTTTRIFALAAAAACAAGLSACQSEVPVPGPTNGGDTTPVAPTTGAEQPTGSAPTGAPTTGSAPTAGAVEARDIEPITFTDEAVGLTETCDQIITDFKAPSYQKDGDETTTIYLLHCTLDYSGGLSYDDEAAGDLKLIDDKDEFHYGRAWSLSSLDEDVKAAGMDPISYDDRGTTHVDGWFAFTVSGSDGKADPLPEGATTLVYERNAFTNKGTGKTYEAYSARSKVTIK